MMGDMGVGGTAALVARLQARQVGQGTELGVKVGCSQKDDKSPKGLRDTRQGSGWAFWTSSKNLGRCVLRMALPPAHCHSLSRLRKKTPALLHIPCENKGLITWVWSPPTPHH